MHEIKRQNQAYMYVIIMNDLHFRLKLKADRRHLCTYSTHRQTPWTDNDFSLLFAALGKAEPLILTTRHQKFDLDL